MPSVSIKTKILGIVIFSSLLISFTFGYLSYQFSKKRVVAMIAGVGRGVASTVASFLSPQDIAIMISEMEDARKAIVSKKYEGWSPRPPLSELYKRYSKYLRDVKVINNIDSPISVYQASGQKMWSIMTSEEAYLMGAPYPIKQEAKDALLTGVPQSTDIYNDKEWKWISSYAAGRLIPGSDKRIVVEVNNRVDSYVEKLREELAFIVSICIFGFLIVSSISYYLVTTLVSAVKRLDEAVQDLEQEHYDKPISVKSTDEIGHLARAFDILRLSIKRKIEELRLSLAREKKAHLESVIALTNAIETRDSYTKKHVNRVHEYAMLIGKGMHLSRDQMIQLKYSCYLHDVGKIYIEEALLKKGKLTHEDFEEIKKHAERGASIIEGIHFLSDVKEAVLYHQERYDGSGYPKGLKGDQIPILARIVSVADAFDAMTSDRPYRNKMTFTYAMDEIEKNSGTQFDPKVCAAFLKYRDSLETMMIKHFKELDL